MRVICILALFHCVTVFARPPQSWSDEEANICRRTIQTLRDDISVNRARLMREYQMTRQTPMTTALNNVRSALNSALTPERRQRLERLQSAVARNGWNNEVSRNLSNELSQLLDPINARFGFLDCPQSPRPQGSQGPLRPMSEYEPASLSGFIQSAAATEANFRQEMADSSFSSITNSSSCPRPSGVPSNREYPALRARRVTAVYNPVTHRIEVLIQNVDRSVRSSLIANSDLLFVTSFDLLATNGSPAGATTETALNHPYIARNFFAGNALLLGQTDEVFAGLDHHGTLGGNKCGTYYRLFYRNGREISGTTRVNPNGVTGRPSQKETQSEQEAAYEHVTEVRDNPVGNSAH